MAHCHIILSHTIVQHFSCVWKVLVSLLQGKGQTRSLFSVRSAKLPLGHGRPRAPQFLWQCRRYCCKASPDEWRDISATSCQLGGHATLEVSQAMCHSGPSWGHFYHCHPPRWIPPWLLPCSVACCISCICSAHCRSHLTSEMCLAWPIERKREHWICTQDAAWLQGKSKREVIVPALRSVPEIRQDFLSLPPAEFWKTRTLLLLLRMKVGEIYHFLIIKTWTGPPPTLLFSLNTVPPLH